MTTEKDKILKFAKARFISEGFYKISMDEIASELHVSKKTIYKYFPSKEGLVTEIAKKDLEEFNDSIKEILKQKSDVITKIVEILDLHLTRVSGYSDKWTKNIEFHIPDLWIEVNAFWKHNVFKNLAKLMEQGKKEKIIENIPAEIILVGTAALMKAILQPEFLRTYNLTFNKATHYALKMILLGLLTPKGRLMLKNLIKKEKYLKHLDLTTHNI